MDDAARVTPRIPTLARMPAAPHSLRTSHATVPRGRPPHRVRPSWWQRLRRQVTLHRRLLAALLTAAAVFVALRAAQPPPGPQSTVWVAVRDLGGGTSVNSDAFEPRLVPAAVAPANVVDPAAVAGRMLAGPVRSGETLTDTRLARAQPLGADGASVGDGQVLSPVRLSDAAAARLLRPGDRVDLVAADPAGGPAVVIAPGARVVTLPRTGERTTTDLGRLVVVSTSYAEALALARAAVTDVLTFTVPG